MIKKWRNKWKRTLADLLDKSAAYAKDLKALTARQTYFLDVPGTSNTKDLSVVSFQAAERVGEPYRITIELCLASL